MLRISEEHVWVRADEDGIGTVGITIHAQDTLGDIVFVELPAVGRVLTAGDAGGVVESVKAAADVYAPVSGTVLEANTALSDDPSVVNSDPLGAGWIYKIRLANPAELNALMEEEDYDARMLAG